MAKRYFSLFIIVLYSALAFTCEAQSDNWADSLFAKQLSGIGLNIESTYHHAITRHIGNYSNNGKTANATLGRYFAYTPYIDSLLREYNLPQEYAYIPLAISNMQPSYTGKWLTKGYWGLSYWAAIRYGLTVNDSIDERCDMKKSTLAAILYLKHMTDACPHPWQVITAYANSWQQMQQAYAICGDNAGIWDIYQSGILNNNDIIPKLLAAAYITHYYTFHHITPMAPLHPHTDTIHLAQACTGAHLCECLCMSSDKFRQLNPCIVSEYLPVNYPVILPVDKAALFVAKGDSIYYSDSLLAYIAATRDSLTANTPLSDTMVKEPVPVVEPVNNKITAASTHTATTTYTVKSGDVLGKIAQKFHTTVNHIKTWNNLKNDNIYAGQKLTIYTTATAKASVKTDNSSTYTVKKGDTLSSIARKYATSVERIKQLNRLSGDRIDIGQKLRVK